MPKSQATAFPRHQEEEETDKSKYSKICEASIYGKAKNWLLKTGACLIQVDFHFFAFNEI